MPPSMADHHPGGIQTQMQLGQQAVEQVAPGSQVFELLGPHAGIVCRQFPQPRQLAVQGALHMITGMLLDGAGSLLGRASCSPRCSMACRRSTWDLITALASLRLRVRQVPRSSS